MARQDRLGQRATTVIHNGATIQVYYHNTCVVEANESNVRLYTGGWYTPTTKTRMNQASNQFGLGFRVYQKEWVWYVEYKGKVMPFQDSMGFRNSVSFKR